MAVYVTSKPHSISEWPDKPLTAHRVYQLVNGRQEDQRTVIDLMTALRNLEEQYEGVRAELEGIKSSHLHKWIERARRAEEQYEAMKCERDQWRADADAWLRANDQLGEQADLQGEEAKRLREQLEALTTFLTEVTWTEDMRGDAALRAEDFERLRQLLLFASNPASRPDYPCDCGPDEYCASDQCHGAVPDPAMRPLSESMDLFVNDPSLPNQERDPANRPDWATGKAVVSKCVFCESENVWEISHAAWRCANCGKGGPGVLASFQDTKGDS